MSGEVIVQSETKKESGVQEMQVTSGCADPQK
jgi:hypothetical protein